MHPFLEKGEELPMNYGNTVRYFYNPFEKTELNPQQKFIEILHHDYRFGFVKRMKLKKGAQAVSFATQEYKNLESYDRDYNTYISLNAFTKPSKAAKHIRNINAIYLDLDLHCYNQEHIDFCIANTKAILKREIEDQNFPEPTMMTNTGRGLGLFFVLKRSIANTANTKKQITYWECAYRAIADKLNHILSLENDVLELDTTSIADKSRIVRLPMTVNQNNKRICTLDQIAYNPDNTVKYYDLKDLVAYINEYMPIPEHVQNEKKKRMERVINFNHYKFPFLAERLKRLERLQKRYNQECTNKRRELMCFLYYNTLKQLNPDQARISLYVYNESFDEPLDQEELEHVILSVNSNKPSFGKHEGFYLISDKWIIEKLDLSEEEKTYSGFGSSRKAALRAEKKLANQKKKEERNRRILQFAIAHPEMTYEEIAESFAIGISTLKRVLSASGYSRYQKGNATEQLNLEIEEISASEEDCHNEVAVGKKMPKIKEISNIEDSCESFVHTDNIFLYKKVQKVPLSLYGVYYHGSTGGNSDADSGYIIEMDTGQLRFDLLSVSGTLSPDYWNTE